MLASKNKGLEKAGKGSPGNVRERGGILVK